LGSKLMRTSGMSAVGGAVVGARVGVGVSAGVVDVGSGVSAGVVAVGSGISVGSACWVAISASMATFVNVACAKRAAWVCSADEGVAGVLGKQPLSTTKAIKSDIQVKILFFFMGTLSSFANCLYKYITSSLLIIRQKPARWNRIQCS